VHHGWVSIGSGSGEVVTVWAATLDQARTDWIRYLNSAERQRIERFRRPADRDRFLLGSCLVRALAAARLAVTPARVGIDRTCPECQEPHGKVRVVGDSLSVSVSHSGDWVLVAATVEGEVGVDVESVDPALETGPLARLTLHPVERQALREVDPSRRAAAFARYWTRKEAVLKSTGDGLRSDLTQVLVSDPDEPAELIAWPARPELVGRLWLTDLDLAEGYAASLAFVPVQEPPPGSRQPAVRVREASAVLASLG
jgi:4'-phosphopantetheinyl transferase